ncbi:MAG: efflux RND transporter permease subunit [Sphingomonadaceae bacterium]|jgi:multidrug efflux pump subunit AcrB|nr:efflux RND transporter permease subunit [Sphingomonadaceae bacterium]NCA00599.1 efflux RND transporter permease subunit [Sphingomonadaceae bacterium]
MNLRNISAWCIRNPVPPIVLFVALLLAGIISFSRMDVNNNPDIEFPGAQVVIVQPGAAPTELEKQVTQIVEASLRSINGVDEINSSVREGMSMTFVQFQLGTDIDRAVNDIRDSLTKVRSDLPDGILEPQVNRVDTTGEAIAYISAEAVDMSLEQLSWYVDDVVVKRLQGVPGAAAINREGGVSREIRVILDPAKMQAFGITAAQVNNQLRQSNLNAAGGRTEIAGAEQSVRVLGNARDAFQLGETNIALGGGRFVKLSALADVQDLYGEQRSISTMNGRQVLSFSIQRAKGASDVKVYDAVWKELRKIQKENPKIHFTELYTSVDYTKAQYKSSIAAMTEGAILAVLVVWLFLRDRRATIISAIAIPLSAIPTFWFMEMLGFSLNQISMLALSLVAGVLVDDAIVEIENIVRHMRMGKSAYQASIDAADEIGLAVVATTFSIVAVFLPVGMMPGVSGEFFKNFGFTVVAAVLLSLAVARMITPMIAAYFLKAHGEETHGEGPLMDRYMSILRWTLLNRRWVVVGGATSLAATVGVMFTLPFQFQPTLDFDYSQVRVEMVPGTTLKQTETVVGRIQDDLKRNAPEVVAAFADIDPGRASIYLRLTPERDITSDEFQKAWGKRFSEIPDARVTFQSQTGGFSGRDITITLGGSDPVVLEQTAQKLTEEMRGLKEIVAPRIGGDMLRPEITIKPRADLAASMGVTTAALSQTIRIATLGDIDQNSAKFSLSDRQVPIRVSLSEQSRRSLATLENLPVPTSTGGSVPLKTVAEISFGAGPTTIQRSNQNRRISIGADFAVNPKTGKPYVNSQAMAAINDLPTMKALPQGVQKLTLGDARWQQEMVTNFLIACLTGIASVFAVLVLLYRRFVPPLVNMGSLLLAPLGGLIALKLFGFAISMPVLIGILMLFGIVAKNSILLIDFALEEIDKGVPRFEAIMDAGHKRAQPIVMTTVAMVAGMVPTALALTGDGAFAQPMGVTVIGGLIVSTFLTLLIVPASFSLAVGFEGRVGPWLRYHLTTGGHDEMATTPPRLLPTNFWSRVKRRVLRRPYDAQPAE